jgi:aliphatic nitrilase
VAKAAADPAGHYARPDVTRLLFNNRPANRVEMLTLPVDQVTESAAKVEPAPTTTKREGPDPTPRPVAAE